MAAPDHVDPGSDGAVASRCSQIRCAAHPPLEGLVSQIQNLDMDERSRSRRPARLVTASQQTWVPVRTLGPIFVCRMPFVRGAYARGCEPDPTSRTRGRGLPTSGGGLTSAEPFDQLEKCYP